MKKLLLFFVFVIPDRGQSVQLGTPADPCAGGAPLTIANTSNTTRWDALSFTCTFPVPTDGLYIVELDILEPCYQAGACAAGQITKPGQRVQNAYVNDQPVFLGLDTFRAGATDTVPAVRKILAYSTNSSIVVRLQTVLRSCVLTAVSITPFNAVVGALTTGPVTVRFTAASTGFVDIWLDNQTPNINLRLTGVNSFSSLASYLSFTSAVGFAVTLNNPQPPASRTWQLTAGIPREI